MPTEAALRVVAEKIGNNDPALKVADRTKQPNAYADLLKSKYETIATLDFSSQRKCMSMLIRGLIPGVNSLLLKGATERVIEKCATYKDRSGAEKQLTAQHK